MRRLFLYISIGISIPCSLIGQTESEISKPISHKNSLVDSLISERKQKNQNLSHWDGYRIQIYSSSNRNEAQDKQTEFSKRFPDHKNYLVYNQPYYRLRVGNYLTKSEVYNRFGEIKTNFPTAFIVADKVFINK